jgi:hypothetical protein
MNIIIDKNESMVVIPSKLFNPNLFEYEYGCMMYNYYSCKVEWGTKTFKMYATNRNKSIYKIRLGLATYYLNTHYHLLKGSDDEKVLLDIIINKSGWYTDPMHLRHDQNDALINLSKINRGIISVYTGWGKTEVTSVMVKNLLTNTTGNILVLGNKNTIIDELKNRLSKVIDYTPEYFGDSRLNVISPVGFMASNYYKSGQSDDWFKSVKCVIMDEVDCISNSASELLLKLDKLGCEYFYGMSATADKKRARRIPADTSLLSMMNPDLNAVVNTFSHSVVHCKPDNFNINLVKVNMGRLNCDFIHDVDPNNIAYDITYNVVTSKKYLDFLYKVMNKGKPFVPINYTTIIDEWINHFKDKRLITISSMGYNYYVNGTLQDKFSLEDLKSVVKIGEFDAIFTTASGFSALDLPELTDVVLLAGTMANSIIQYIGRVSRSKEFTIWYANFDNKVPSYTNKLNNQLELVKEYYANCNIKELEHD